MDRVCAATFCATSPDKPASDPISAKASAADSRFNITTPSNTLSGSTPVTKGGNGNLTATLSAPSVGATVVRYSVGGNATPGDDYTALSGSVSIPDGQTFAPIPAATVDDAIDEADETVLVTLARADNGAAIGSPAAATITIPDNATAGVTVTGGPLTFTPANWATPQDVAVTGVDVGSVGDAFGPGGRRRPAYLRPSFWMKRENSSPCELIRNFA